ncbi:MAG: hypothetical protein ABR520_10080 [Mycobacteriales bacterium]|nr:hypothetical protein [Frankia sp.]
MDFLVGTDTGLFRLTETGGLEQLLDGPIRHVVAADEGAVALRGDGSLWSIDDDGAAEFDELSGVTPTCLLLDDEDVWLGTTGAHLLLLRGGELTTVEAFDAVADREKWYTPWGAPPDTRSMDIDDDGTLYVAVHVGGIVRSLDGGQSWAPTLDIDLDVHQVVTVPEYAQTVVAACASGMALTTDQGESWEVEADGLHASYSRAIAVAGDHVVLSVSDGPDGGRGALYQRLLESSIFTRCREGLPDWFSGNIDTHCLAAWDEVVLAGAPDGTVYWSADSGQRWRQIASGLPAIRAVAIP